MIEDTMVKRIKNHRGVAAVEFALVLPLLVLIALGIIEFSLALYDKAVITNASREGARAGIVFGVPSVTDGDIIELVNAYCGSRLISFGADNQVTTTVSREPPGTTGDDLTVQVSYQYQFLAIPRFLTGLTEEGHIELAAQTIMRME